MASFRPFLLRTLTASFLALCSWGFAPFAESAENSFEIGSPHGFAEDKLPSVELNSSLLFQLVASEIALQRNQLGAAYKTYMSMAESTRDPRLAERAVQIAQAANAFKELKNSVLLWNKLAPGNQRAQELLIHVALFSGELQKIQPFIKNYLSQLQDPTEALLKIQLLLSQNKDRQRALNYFRTVSSPYPKNLATILGLGRLELLAGNNREALKYTQKAYSLTANTETVLAYSAALLKDSPQKAVALLTGFVDKNPGDLKAKESLARFLLVTGDREKLKNLAKDNLGSLPLTLFITDLFVQQRDADTASELLKLFLQSSSAKLNEQELDKIYLMLGELLIQKGNYSEALFYLLKIRVPELRRPADIQISAIYSKQGEAEKALKLLDSITSENEEQLEELLILKGKVLSETKGDEAALAFLESRLKEMPKSKELLYAAAMTAEELEKIPLMEKYLKEAIRLDPNFANAYNSLGYTLLEKTNRIREAAGYIQKAYRLEPNNPFILDSMGWLAFKQGRFAESIRLLTAAFNGLRQEEIASHLMEVYLKANRRKEAGELLKLMKVLWPESETTTHFETQVNEK
jgi:tetratricopeptide (TPR) repeat protein